MRTNSRDSIETANAPLAFRLGDVNLEAPPPPPEVLAFRVATRALTGMQKEAYVAQSGSDVRWRMVCDEGPYLNGTDLAPPPLAFFSAGMASAHAEAIRKSARDLGSDVAELKIVQDNRYSMQGSAVKGTMIAGALPVELDIRASLVTDSASVFDVVSNGLQRSPVDALMRDALTDTFSITHNGRSIGTGAVAGTQNSIPADPSSLFGVTAYAGDLEPPGDVLSKLETTASVFEADHGAGAAMKDVQKRELHIRSVLTLREDGLREIRVQIFKPIGSVFRFLTDDSQAVGGKERAPGGLALVSAGIAFCFMTQLGRYAGIVKKDLAEYGIVQDTAFDFGSAKTLPVDTHAFLRTSENDAVARQYVDMGERTCFLHGACRTSNTSRIRIRSSD